MSKEYLPIEYYRSKYQLTEPSDNNKKSVVGYSLLGALGGAVPGAYLLSGAKGNKAKQQRALTTLVGGSALGATLAAIITHKQNKKLEKQGPDYTLDDLLYDDILDAERYNKGTDPLKNLSDQELSSLWGLKRK